MESRHVRNSNPLAAVDWWTVAIYVALLAFGWISICGASHEIGNTDFFSWDTRTGKQLVWMACSCGLGFVILMLDEKYFESFAGLIYAGMMLLLLVTPFLAGNIKGSYSWIKLGPVSLQPAEFAKCATALAMARLMGQYGFALDSVKSFLKAAALILLPMLLIINQRETGSALVYLAFFLMLYREGMPGCFLFAAVAAVTYFVVGIRFSEMPFPFTDTPMGSFLVLTMIWLFTVGMLKIYCSRTPHAKRVLLWGSGFLALTYGISAFLVPFDVSIAMLIGLGILFLYLCWTALGERVAKYVYIALFTLGSVGFFCSCDYIMNHSLQPHQQMRIRVLLGMEENLRGAGYNVNQSKIAIGSGGLVGKGFMNGTQTKLKYVPEQDTDFIFCTVGEEQGFIGSAAVLLLFLTLILRLVHLAERQPTAFGRVYGYSVLSIFLFHVFINIGMVMGLTPVIGIPLPFFSYGGSSLWGFSILLFIFLRIDAARGRLLR